MRREQRPGGQARTGAPAQGGVAAAAPEARHGRGSRQLAQGSPVTHRLPSWSGVIMCGIEKRPAPQPCSTSPLSGSSCARGQGARQGGRGRPGAIAKQQRSAACRPRASSCFLQPASRPAGSAPHHHHQPAWSPHLQHHGPTQGALQRLHRRALAAAAGVGHAAVRLPGARAAVEGPQQAVAARRHARHLANRIVGGPLDLRRRRR